MAVTGIGGIFFKSNDVANLQDWYKTYLGISFEKWGTVFHWKDAPDGSTTFSIASNESKRYAGNFMINFRVQDLDQMLHAMREAGQKVDEQVLDEQYGKFAWVYDPDGNKIELWEPIDGLF